MRQEFKMSEMRGLKGQQLSRQVRAMVEASRQPLNGEVKDLNKQIQVFEERYGIISAELPRKLSDGKIKETWEICEWLGLIQMRDDLATYSARPK